MAHSDAETRASVGFVPEAGRLGGRPRNPSVIDRLREKVEAQSDEIVSKLWDLVENATRTVVVGTGPNAYTEVVPDNDLRLKALRELLDRSHGRPKQATEISGPGGGAIPTAPLIPEDADWHAEALKAADELGLLDPVVPPSPEVAAHANGNGNGRG
jgi:hypothetical protein